MRKRLLAIIVTLVIFITGLFSAGIAVNAAENNSKQLMVMGNRLVYESDPGTVVRLTGMNIPGGEWTGTPGAEHLLESAKEAVNNWSSNVLRLAVGIEGWYGRYSYVYDGGRSYRNYIDGVISYASEAGVYVVLDLHHYQGFNNQDYLSFWREAAAKYANNPTVLFGILNEPHGTSWEVWRNGDGGSYKGHQYVVEMIRDLGAKNIIVAGGLDWAYDLTGIANGYALVDCGSNNNTEKTGYGIMYDTHIYPWKGLTANWDSKVGEARKKYPILVGENGWDPATNLAVGQKVYEQGSPFYHDQWCPALFDWMNDAETYGNYANYTAYSFHPGSAPKILVSPDVNGNNFGSSSYAFTPTDFWGVYVKAALKADVSTRFSAFGTPDSISVVNPKRVYQVGESFDNSQGSIVVRFESSVLELDFSNPNISVSGFDTTAAVNAQTVTISYMGASTQYTIKVKELAGAGSVADEDIHEKHLSLDFEDAVVGPEGSETDLGTPVTVTATNKVNNSEYNINTYMHSVYYPTVGTDSTNYLSVGRYCSYEYNMPSALGDTDELIYVDFRLGRNTERYEGNFDMDFVDSSAKKLFSINFTPRDGNTTITADDVYETAYPDDAAWRCVRAVINMNAKTFELYQGESFDSMQPFSSEKQSFAFADMSAGNLAMITNRDSAYISSVKFDDVKVYTVKLEEEEVPGIEKVEVSGAKTEYNMGDEFSTALGTITIYYTDGTIDYTNLNSPDVTVTGYDKDKAGDQTITARWHGNSAEYTIHVNYKNYLKSISVKNTVNRYIKGSAFNYYGALVCHYYEGNTEELDFDASGAAADGFDSSSTGRKTINVTYNDFKTSYEIEVVDEYTDAVSSITARNYQTSYKMGDSLNLEKGVIVLHFENGTIGYLPLGSEGVSVYGYDTDTEGNQTIYAEYADKKCEFTIYNEYNVYLKSITADGVKTEYDVGDDFDFLTGAVTLRYSDGSVSELPLHDKSVTVKGFDSSVAGRQTVTVTYKTYSVTYDINVSKVLSSITAHDYKTEYEVGEAFDYESGYITAVYNDGSSEKLLFSDPRVQIARFSTDKAGSLTVMFVVASNGMTKRFNASITVVEPENPYRLAVEELASGEEISGRAIITAAGGSEGSGMLVLAAYDSNNCLKAVRIINIDFSDIAEPYPFTLSGSASLEGTVFRAFLWNASMEPVSNIFTY